MQLFDRERVDRSAAHEDIAFLGTLDDAAVAEHHLADLRRRLDDADHGRGRLRDAGRTVGDLGAEARETLVLRRVDVVGGHVEACLQQVGGHAAPHHAHADEADGGVAIAHESPPETSMVNPVIKSASLESRKAMTPA